MQSGHICSPQWWIQLLQVSCISMRLTGMPRSLSKHSIRRWKMCLRFIQKVCCHIFLLCTALLSKQEHLYLTEWWWWWWRRRMSCGCIASHNIEAIVGEYIYFFKCFSFCSGMERRGYYWVWCDGIIVLLLHSFSWSCLKIQQHCNPLCIISPYLLRFAGNNSVTTSALFTAVNTLLICITITVFSCEGIVLNCWTVFNMLILVV